MGGGHWRVRTFVGPGDWPMAGTSMVIRDIALPDRYGRGTGESEHCEGRSFLDGTCTTRPRRELSHCRHRAGGDVRAYVCALAGTTKRLPHVLLLIELTPAARRPPLVGLHQRLSS